jgi:hypothetical protein
MTAKKETGEGFQDRILRPVNPKTDGAHPVRLKRCVRHCA